MIKWLIAILAMIPGAAVGAEPAVVPQGCSPRVTVHKNSCATSIIMQCSDGFEVHGYRDGRRDQGHAYFPDWGLASFDYQGDSGTRFLRVPDEGDWMKLSDLIANGEDTEEGTMLFTTRVVNDREFKIVGRYTLDGEEAYLSGKAFRTGKLKRRFERPGIESSRLEVEFDILVSEELNLFIEGSHLTTLFGQDPYFADYTPRAVVFEGEDGFLATSSQYGCTQ
ncbi:MAG: hypothetical protein AB3N13_03425 [Arenibacterium sp.]